MHTNLFEGIEEQTSTLADELYGLIFKLLKKKQNVVIGVSGGKTPIRLFEKLSKLDLPWERILITLVDERIVEVISEDSNEYLVKTHLLKNCASSAKFIGLVNTSLSVEKMVEVANREIPLIDIIILGMGDDGHTASLFADCKELDIALDENNTARYINTNPVLAKYSRISLTLSAILQAQSVFVLIGGDAKLKVFNEALNGCNRNYPISYVLNLRSDVVGYWTK